MKTILISLLMLTATVARAQITIAEPKFEQEATIVMNDTAGVETPTGIRHSEKNGKRGDSHSIWRGQQEPVLRDFGREIACDAEQRLLREGFAVDFLVVRQQAFAKASDSDLPS